MATEAKAAPTLRPGITSGRRRFSLAWLGAVPFFAYALLFLFLPAAEVLIGAFRGAHGGATFANVHALIHKPYVHQYWISIKISLITAALGALLGLLIAYAAIRDRTPGWIRTVITTFSGVAANFAGIPLAFAFIATVGNVGIVTLFLRQHLHFDITTTKFPGLGYFSLFSAQGVELVYLYFQIPLMILVIAPAIDGLRREWREASANLGATSFQFWRYVGIPVLLPSIMGAFILLFGNSFAAYATAYALTSGGAGVQLVPITIGYFFSGNALSNPHLAQALALGMFVVLGMMMVIYVPLQRRAARWAK